MTKKVLIGIPTCPFRDEWAKTPFTEMDIEAVEYFWLLSRLTNKIITSVRAAGGIPAPLSATRDEAEITAIAERMDGFVFAGGNDIAPEYYNEENKGSLQPDAKRDFFELALCREALRLEKPIFGICRGCQLLNVALGGTLLQDLPSVNEEWKLHRRSDVTRGYVHDVRILEPQIFPPHKGEIMRVNSMHHQAVGRLADGVEAAAATDDGIIEAIWAPKRRYAVGVQWHPECLAEDDPVQAELFRSLVARSGE